jgi:hypothetical protein
MADQTSPVVSTCPIYLSSIGIEVWAQVPNFPNCQVSNMGRFKSLERRINRPNDKGYIRPEKIMLQKSTDTSGYFQIRFTDHLGNRYRFSSHRLVALVFIPNPNNLPFINHKKGIKTDNRACAIEWTTHQENIDHAVETGLMKRGADLPYSKLVLDFQTGIYYDSITEAAIAKGYKNRTLHHWLIGDRANRSSLVLV